jgi:hypothetical protein
MENASITSSKDNDETYLDAKNMDFTTKEKYYYRSIDKYYKQLSIDIIKLMIPIINSESKISLRQLDWLVTKYADKNMIIIKTNNERINVHISYKAQLKSFKKKYFDPFKRYKKFNYTFKIDNKDVKIVTTIGQLNFFKWVFKTEIINYVNNNFNILTPEMKKDKEKEKKDKDKEVDTNSISSNSKISISKNGLVITANKIQSLMNKDNKIIVSFD